MTSSVRAEGQAILGTVLEGTAARYFIQDVLGEGGQGWVFRASYDDAEGFPVVVKILRPDTATTEALERFRREAEILRRLSQHNPSPYIVRFFDAGEASFPLPSAGHSSGRAVLPFTVLEYVHGESLHQVLDRQRGMGLGISRGRRIAREIAKALEIVHAQGIVHRDLKPSNILLASEAGREVAKVTDFGLVKVVDLTHTATQAVAGVSLSYAPPEQYEPGNPRVGPHTDVFSYAAIVFELMCGREAFPATSANPFESLRAIATGNRPKLADRISSLPLGLNERLDVVRRLDVELTRALSPEPNDRHRTIAELWDALEPLLREADGRGGEVTGKMASAATEPAGPSAQRGRGASPAPVGQVHPVSSGVRPIAAMPMLAPQATARSGAPPDPSEPRAWSWRLLSPGAPRAHVRDGLVDDALQSIVTLGSAGVVRWSPTAGWVTLPLGGGVPLGELRGVGRLPNGSIAVCGERGLIAFQGAQGWDVRRFPDADVAFHALAVDASGTKVVAVGERVSRGHGVVVELAPTGWRRTLDVTDAGPLRSVAFYDASVVFACGDGGGLVRVDDQGCARVPWQRSGHLRALVAHRPSARIVAVGSGGHALAVGAAPAPASSATIERVMTTQDLLGACVGTDGVAWATSANARVVRRDPTGTWRRVTTDLPTAGNLLRIASLGDRVLVLADDAAILEGTFARG